jgi:hypothetical protein
VYQAPLVIMLGSMWHEVELAALVTMFGSIWRKVELAHQRDSLSSTGRFACGGISLIWCELGLEELCLAVRAMLG